MSGHYLWNLGVTIHAHKIADIAKEGAPRIRADAGVVGAKDGEYGVSKRACEGIVDISVGRCLFVAASANHIDFTRGFCILPLNKRFLLGAPDSAGARGGGAKKYTEILVFIPDIATGAVMAAVQDDVKARTARDPIHEKSADFVVGNHSASGGCRRVVIQGAKTRVESSGGFIAVGIADQGSVAGEMEYGFIAGDHPCDEGGHPREDILAGGR